MNEALAGFLQELAGFVERVLEEQDGEGGEGEGYGNDEGTGDGMMGEEMGHGIMNGEEIMRKVVDALTVGGRKGEGKDEAEGKLVISEDVVEKIVQGVRREVEGVVKCVDGEGWVG